MKAADTYRHKGLRRSLVKQLREKGITSEEVLSAIGRVPRHLFMRSDSVFDELAYQDRAFNIGEGQTISQPFTVAYQTELMEVKPGSRVLEVGTGSGYQAAVLAEMGVHVYTIERVKALYNRTQPLIAKLGFRTVQCFLGDGFEGLPQLAPFDGILITAAAPEVPQSLLKQLAIGVHLVFPLGIEASDMMRITRTLDGDYRREMFDKFRFVPMLKGTKE